MQRLTHHKPCKNGSISTNPARTSVKKCLLSAMRLQTTNRDNETATNCSNSLSTLVSVLKAAWRYNLGDEERGLVNLQSFNSVDVFMGNQNVHIVSWWFTSRKDWDRNKLVSLKGYIYFKITRQHLTCSLVESYGLIVHGNNGAIFFLSLACDFWRIKFGRFWTS